ncbi:DUF2269 family protein [Virgibacillus soli]|uniref:DUF2269 family protein n=1 Tax=Paracerasibacillus soli TaxID=480284 RepID=A0ABU5CWX4_9BACI|nr:DUF2269 family protein [Virgibacillus soli]MDY0410381.1 DUF2269 family protein [Virgibacillus soli]
MTLYQVLLFIHIFSAIIGLGPGFIMTLIPVKAQNMAEVRHAYRIRTMVHIIIMIGGTLLLVTGLTMGFLNPALFRAGWYVTSLTLYMVALAMGPFVLKPFSRPIKELLKTYQGEEIPEEYYVHARKVFNSEHVENIIFIIIISLMILKPF